MIGPAWYEVARERAPFASVATELELVAMGHGSWSPCPGCGAEQRGSDDRRGPIGTADARGWRCHRCDAGGSVLDLVALKLTGDQSLRGPAGATVRAWFAERSWCEAGPGEAPRLPPRPRPPPPAPLPAPPKPRPASLAKWWRACTPVDEDDQIAAYLRGRGIDPLIVAERDLARVAPTRPGPAWRPDGPYRLVVPMYDAAGALASVRLRRVVDRAGPKSLAPKGCDASGVVFACPLGRLLLQAGTPEWWPADRRLEVVIAEGEIDHLALATATGDADPCSPAILAIGHWREDLAARIPSGALVTIATDNDPAGHRYASRIGATLGRCELRRWVAAA